MKYCREKYANFPSGSIFHCELCATDSLAIVVYAIRKMLALLISSPLFVSFLDLQGAVRTSKFARSLIRPIGSARGRPHWQKYFKENGEDSNFIVSAANA